MAEPLLEVDDLTVDYLTDTGDVRAVDRVSFTLEPGEFLGIVGESGSGKSTLLFGVAQLLSPPGQVTAGKVVFRGHDMVRLSPGELRAMRWRDYSVVMQSAMNALNPMKTIAAQFKDTLEAHDRVSANQVRERSAEVLSLVGIDAAHLKSYPHQLSGGMRQRAVRRRPHRRDVRRPGRRGRRDRGDLRSAAAPVHARADERLPVGQGPAAGARRPPRGAAGPREAADGLPVPSALCRGHAGVREPRARAVRGQRRRRTLPALRATGGAGALSRGR